MKTLHSAIIGLTLLAGTAQADVVTDWNQTAIEVMKAVNVAGNPWTRSMAMMHVAMSDAVNTVQGRYTRFIATGPAAPGASAEAAASAAAREMLLQPLSEPERQDRRSLCGVAQVHSGRGRREE